MAPPSDPQAPVLVIYGELGDGIIGTPWPTGYFETFLMSDNDVYGVAERFWKMVQEEQWPAAAFELSTFFTTFIQLSCVNVNMSEQHKEMFNRSRDNISLFSKKSALIYGGNEGLKNMRRGLPEMQSWIMDDLRRQGVTSMHSQTVKDYVVFVLGAEESQICYHYNMDKDWKTPRPRGLKPGKNYYGQFSNVWPLGYTQIENVFKEHLSLHATKKAIEKAIESQDVVELAFIFGFFATIYVQKLIKEYDMEAFSRMNYETQEKINASIAFFSNFRTQVHKFIDIKHNYEWIREITKNIISKVSKELVYQGLDETAANSLSTGLTFVMLYDEPNPSYVRSKLEMHANWVSPEEQTILRDSNDEFNGDGMRRMYGLV
jgi:hypothetical protein